MKIMKSVKSVKTVQLALAAVGVLLLSTFARADVGDRVDVSFDGVVTKVSGGAVTAKAYVKIVWESGEITSGVGEIRFQCAGSARPKVGDAIDGSVSAQIVWQTSGTGTIVARVQDGQWATARASGGIQRGSILGVSTGASTEPDD